MKNLLKKTLLIFTVLVLSGYLKGFTQEEVNVDILIGQSIQKYLEGNITGAIEDLDKVLTEDPDHERARNLLIRATDRLTENVKSTGEHQQGLRYLEIAEKHLPDNENIQTNLREVRAMSPAAEEVSPRAETRRAPDPAPAPVAQQQEPQASAQSGLSPEAAAELEEYKRRVDELNAYIRNLRVQTARSPSVDTSQLEARLDQLISEREELIEKIDTIDRVGFLPVVGGIILIGVLIAGFAGLLALFKSENSRIRRNIEDERRTVESLKNTYNKDTQKLSEKLQEYGKSYKRAEELERNWQKVFGIMEKLTEGGSNEKVVLDDAATGRKAVTGVDPRVRARADSVEVIADIFKDSPQAAEMLRPFLDDKDNRTRANAAVSYYRYDPEKAVAILHEMAKSKDKWMRISAAWAIGAIGDSDTSFVLENLLDDDDLQVKETARKSLSRIIGSQAAREKIEESTKEEEKE